jgi:peroxiredoxin
MEDMQKKQHGLKRRLPLVWVLGAILVVALAWGGLVLFTRGRVSPTSCLTSLAPGSSVSQADSLPSATDGQEAYVVWSASAKEQGSVSTLYTTHISNPFQSSGLARILLAPSSVSVGIVVDESTTIQEVRILDPRILVGAPGTLASFLEGFKGMSFFQVLTAADGFAPAGGGALAAPVSALVKNLAMSAYLRDMGKEGFDRFMAQVNSPGLRLDFPFPYFAAKTWQGDAFNLGQLKGKNVLVAFTQPTCGSCFEATMTLLNTVAIRKFDITPVVFIFGDPQLEPVQRFAKDAPAGTILISDPKEDLARSVHQTLAPYAVILDDQHIIRYSGASGKTSPVYLYLEKLAGAQ